MAKIIRLPVSFAEQRRTMLAEREMNRRLFTHRLFKLALMRCFPMPF